MPTRSAVPVYQRQDVRISISLFGLFFFFQFFSLRARKFIVGKSVSPFSRVIERGEFRGQNFEEFIRIVIRRFTTKIALPIFSYSVPLRSRYAECFIHRSSYLLPLLPTWSTFSEPKNCTALNILYRAHSARRS